MKYWSMQILKKPQKAGPVAPLGTFIFETEEEIFPDLAGFIVALGLGDDELLYTPPLEPTKDLPVHLLSGMKPFFIGDRMTVWQVDWAN